MAPAAGPGCRRRFARDGRDAGTVPARSMSAATDGTLDADAEYTEYVRSRMTVWRRTAYLMCGDWDRGDDVVQRTMTELYRKWPKARRADNLDALVRTMLLRRMLDERRLGWFRVRLTTELPDRAAPAGSDPDDRVTLMAALRGLAPGQRAVLVLRFFQDLTVEETADALACSPGTVKSQTSKALATLRRSLTVKAGAR
ncbi:RNA polymerase sigma24 factor [Rugosimonospora africana]|uniref:RNA polymerase sigma24 factor n=2 Tax=Rugosimonospora africana TaxID=556532 RepID=A0A8J3VSS4_9ACTN|nr:RNA polymerase sigma24 factor [Rugosimonospora africana]